MNKTASLSQTQVGMPISVEEWCTLDKTLLSYIKSCLYSYHIRHWQGSEPEIANDVLQETYLRALRFSNSNEAHNEVSSIHNFEAFCKTIAKRYILDLRRKDKRFAGSLDNDDFFVPYTNIAFLKDPAEIAIQNATLYSIMLTLSQIVNRFPEAQRTAILIDLARITNFDDECPSPLETAMMFVGIPLRLYDRALPDDPVLRSRHNASLSIAYKRLRLAFQNTASQLLPAA